MKAIINILGTILVVWISMKMVQPGNRIHIYLLILIVLLGKINLWVIVILEIRSRGK